MSLFEFGFKAFARDLFKIFIDLLNTAELLDQFDSGEANFWSDIHQPFKNSLMTRDTAKSLILAAKERYQTNLPGLAVKLRACKDRSNIETDKRKKFLSFKNFLYKTVKISTN